MKARKDLGEEWQAGFVRMVLSRRGLVAKGMNNACYHNMRGPRARKPGSTHSGAILIVWPPFRGEDHLVPSQRTPEAGEDSRGRNITFDTVLEIRA